MNESITAEMRDKARELLESERVDCVIGYEASARGGARPVFIYDPADVERLVWNERCVHNLVTYLHDKKKPQKRGEEPQRIAIVAKPCDSRAVNVLLAEQQIARERVFVIGVACEGMEEAESRSSILRIEPTSSSTGVCSPPRPLSSSQARCPKAPCSMSVFP